MAKIIIDADSIPFFQKLSEITSAIASAKENVSKDPIVLGVHVSEGLKNVSLLEEKLRGLRASALFDVIPQSTKDSLPAVIENLRKIKEYKEGIAKGEEVKPPFDPEDMQAVIDQGDQLASRLEDITRLQKLMNNLTPDEMNEAVLQLTKNLEANEEQWRQGVESIGAADAQAQVLNATVAKLSSGLKEVNPETIRALAQEFINLNKTAGEAGRPVSREAFRKTLDEFVNSQRLSLEQANAIETSFFAQSERGWTSRSRMLSTQLGLSRVSISQLASVLGAAVPELSPFVNIIYQLSYAFTGLGIAVVGAMTAINLYNNLQKTIALQEREQLNILAEEGRSREKNTRILMEYQRVKNTSPLGLLPLGGVIRSSDEEMEALAKQANVQARIAREIEATKTAGFRVPYGIGMGAEEDVKAVRERMNELQAEIRGLQRWSPINPDFAQQAKETEAVLFSLEKQYMQLAGLSDEDLKTQEAKAIVIELQKDSFREQSVILQAQAKSAEDLTNEYLKLKGLSLEDLTRPLETGPMLPWDAAGAQERNQRTLDARRAAEQAAADFQKQIERVTREEADKREELVFYAKLLSDPQNAARIDEAMQNAQKTVDANPLKATVQVQGTEELEESLKKILNMPDLKDPIKIQQALGALPLEKLKTILQPEDFDALLAKLNEFNLANKGGGAQVLQQREQLIATYVKENVHAQITLSAQTKSAQLESQRAVEANRFAALAALPADANKRMNEEIQKYVLSLGDVKTLTQQHLSAVMQIQNATIANNAGSKQLSLLETSKLLVLKEQAQQINAIASAYAFQGESVRSTAEAERSRIRALEQIEWMNKNQPRFDYYFEDRMKSIQRFNEQTVKNEEEFWRRMARARFEFERDQAHSDEQRRKSIADADNEHNIRRLRSEEDFQLEMARMYTRYIYDLDDAISNRDAVAVVRIQRNYELQKKEREENFQRDRERDEADYQRRKAIDEARYQEERAWRRMLFEEQQVLAREEYERQKAERKEAMDRQLADAEQAHNRMLAQQAAALEFQRKQVEHNAVLQAEDRKHQEKLRLDELARNLAEQEDITKAEAERIFKIWDRIYGTGDGSIAKGMQAAFDAQRETMDKFDVESTAVLKRKQEEWLAIRGGLIELYNELYNPTGQPSPPSTTGGGTGGGGPQLQVLQKPLEEISKVSTTSDEHLNAIEGTGLDMKSTAEDIQSVLDDINKNTSSNFDSMRNIDNNTRNADTRLGYINQDAAEMVGYLRDMGGDIYGMKYGVSDVKDAVYAVANLVEASSYILSDILYELRVSPAQVNSLLGSIAADAGATNVYSRETMFATRDTAYLVGDIQPTLVGLNNNIVSAIFAALPAYGGGQGGPQLMAEGGAIIANKPTTAIFGEQAPELATFIPLDKLSEAGITGASSMNINVNISGDIGGQVSEDFEDKMLKTLTDAIVEAMPAKFLGGST